MADHTEKWYDISPPDKVDALERRVEEMEHHLKGVEARLSYLVSENLKLVNRLLEAEIALERAKNYLVRNHIPFPFVPSRPT